VTRYLEEERELAEAMKGRPFVFVTVSSDEYKEGLVRFLKKEPMPGTHWWVGPRLLDTWDAHIYMTKYAIDHKGVIRYRWSYLEGIGIGNHPSVIVGRLVKAAEAAQQKGKEG
jgi:hypothetical protein